MRSPTNHDVLRRCLRADQGTGRRGCAGRPVIVGTAPPVLCSLHMGDHRRAGLQLRLRHVGSAGACQALHRGRSISAS